MIRLVLILSMFTLFVGCMTPAKEKQMRNDIFNLQTRLLQLESQLTEGKQSLQSSGDANSKRLASTSTELERMSQDIKRMNGEIDALKIGVSTGQMPGQTEQQEGSVAAQLTQIGERLEVIELTQADIVAALEKNGTLKKNRAKGAAAKAEGEQRTAPEVSNVEELQKNFDKKRFKYVVLDAPAVLKKSKGKEKEQATFLFAESLFKLGRIREAAIQYNDFLENKPDKRFMPLAKMRLGDCFRHLGDHATAKIFYEELIKDYPDTPEAEKAKERLASDKPSEKADDAPKSHEKAPEKGADGNKSHKNRPTAKTPSSPNKHPRRG